MTLLNAIVLLQATTFVILAVVLFADGQPKLAAAQALLAIITWLVYA